MPRFRLSLLVLLIANVCSLASAHDSFEITLEIQEKRNSVQARLEMSRSTSTAACDPAESEGVLFDVADFPIWKRRLEGAAPHLIQILDTENPLPLSSLSVSLTREDDVRLDYAFAHPGAGPLRLATPILDRFPQEGFGVLVTYRDRSGRWHPPFMIRIEDEHSSPLPPE